MPIIKTTTRHAMLLQTPPEGRYLIQIKKIEEKPNKKQDGTNLVYDLEIADGDFKGKVIQVYASMSHDIGIATALAIHQAATGDMSGETTFNTDEEIGLQLIGEIDHEIYNGNKQARLNTFLPLKNPVTGEPTPMANLF